MADLAISFKLIFLHGINFNIKPYICQAII
jgi:hypothetical protein